MWHHASPELRPPCAYRMIPSHECPNRRTEHILQRSNEHVKWSNLNFLRNGEFFLTNSVLYCIMYYIYLIINNNANTFHQQYFINNLNGDKQYI